MGDVPAWGLEERAKPVFQQFLHGTWELDGFLDCACILVKDRIGCSGRNLGQGD